MYERFFVPEPFFVTNTELPSEKVVISYEKRGNSENYIKEAKYDMAIGYLLLKSFWANEDVFQMMMLAYNMFLLFKIDFSSNRIQTANKDIPIKVCFSCWQNNKDCEVCNYEAFRKISI